MEKKAQINTGVVVTALVMIIVGVISLSVIHEITNKNTKIQSVVNEAVTTSNVTAVQLANTNWATNATCGAQVPFTANLVAGQILWTDAWPSNATICNYTYFDAAYIDSGTARTILDVGVVMFAVLVMVLVVTVLVLRKK